VNVEVEDLEGIGHSDRHLPVEKATPQLRRLIACFPPRRPRFDPRSSYVGIVVVKVALASTSVSPANFYTTDCSILIIYHPGLV
jgi:hypothetical protein